MSWYEEPPPGVDLTEAPFDHTATFKETVTRRLSELDWHRYPDRRQSEVTGRIADHFGVRAEEIVLTRGADEALRLTFQAVVAAGSGLRIPDPSFFGFGLVVTAFDMPWSLYPIGEDPGVSPGWVPVWCSPNNPTGHVTPLAEITETARRSAGPITGVLDLTYDFFADEPLHRHVRELIDDGVVVCVSLSKAFGIAGARVGLTLAREDLVPRLLRFRDRFPMDYFQLSIMDVLFDPNAVNVRDSMVTWVRRERPRLARGLAELVSPDAVGPLHANFVPVAIDSPESVADLVRTTACKIHERERLLRVTVNPESLAAVAALTADKLRTDGPPPESLPSGHSGADAAAR